MNRSNARTLLLVICFPSKEKTLSFDKSPLLLICSKDILFLLLYSKKGLSKKTTDLLESSYKKKIVLLELNRPRKMNYVTVAKLTLLTTLVLGSAWKHRGRRSSTREPHGRGSESQNVSWEERWRRGGTPTSCCRDVVWRWERKSRQRSG
jgi:hypothetical protein